MTLSVTFLIHGWATDTLLQKYNWEKDDGICQPAITKITTLRDTWSIYKADFLYDFFKIKLVELQTPQFFRRSMCNNLF